MVKKSALRHSLIAAAVMGLVVAAAGPASATTIDWTSWSSNTAGTIAPLSISVTFSGQLEGLSSNYPSWTPAATFSGGTISNHPPSSGGMIRLVGGSSTINTITFSSPVVNPVMAIWSLGQGGILANFTFTGSEPFTIESGGPSAEFGGTSIVVCPTNPDAVCGAEGNGTIQFNGTFSQLTWTNTVFENYYGFTVGAAGTSGPPPVPEPGSVMLVASGLALLGVLLYRRSHRQIA